MGQDEETSTTMVLPCNEAECGGRDLIQIVQSGDLVEDRQGHGRRPQMTSERVARTDMAAFGIYGDLSLDSFLFGLFNVGMPDVWDGYVPT